jgi:hypothetical protein
MVAANGAGLTMALKLGTITPEMMKALADAKNREQKFWDRHGISGEGTIGVVSEAHRAWVKAVEHEYNLMGKESRVYLDMPIARRAFILGYRKSKPSAGSGDK